MTQYLGIRDPGAAGGSWIMYLCNHHPARMRILGEAHREPQLDFAGDGEPWPGITVERYDEKVIAFMDSQAAQGIACTGIVKCFWAKGAAHIRARGGRILSLVRNPLLVVGVNRRKDKAPELYLGHAPRNDDEQFLAINLYYKESYQAIWRMREKEPITRIEDYNRSCGTDGRFLKEVMEWATQTDWPDEYIKYVREHCLPGYAYPIKTRRENGVVVGIDSVLSVREPWRMNWYDDPRAERIWKSWPAYERDVFADTMGEVAQLFGYNYLTQPGFVEPDWALRDAYAWSGADLRPIPYEGDVMGLR